MTRDLHIITTHLDDDAHIRAGTEMEGAAATSRWGRLFYVYDGSHLAVMTRAAAATQHEMLGRLLAAPDDGPKVKVSMLVPGRDTEMPSITASLARLAEEQRNAPPPCPHTERTFVPAPLGPGEDKGAYACEDGCGLYLAEDCEEGPIYRCSRCDGCSLGEDGRRCDDCNVFTAKVDDAPYGICPDCLEAPVRPVAVLCCTACEDMIQSEADSA